MELKQAPKRKWQTESTFPQEIEYPHIEKRRKQDSSDLEQTENVNLSEEAILQQKNELEQTETNSEVLHQEKSIEPAKSEETPILQSESETLLETADSLTPAQISSQSEVALPNKENEQQTQEVTQKVVEEEFSSDVANIKLETEDLNKMNEVDCSKKIGFQLLECKGKDQN